MGNFRDFDAEVELRDRPSFRLGGETFTCKAKLSFRKIQKLLGAFTGNVAESELILKVDEFFAVVLMKDDVDRFFAMLDAADEVDDGDGAVDLGQIRDLMVWLVEHYTGNVSGQSTAS